MTRGRSFWLLSIFALALSVVSAGQTPGQGPGPGAGGQRPAAPGTGDRFPQRPGLPGSMRPMRDSAAPLEEGTGRIRGRVTDDAGQPLRRVSVSTMGGQARQPRVALTDADGRYELTGLPAASYYITAAKGAYVRQSYGQRTSTGPGRPIEVALGQTVDKIDFTLPRGGIIVGRVVDEFGEPMAESSVMATRFVNNEGRRRLMPMGRQAQTDDLGQFRLYGLPPGEYFVSATVRSQMMMFGPAGEMSGGDNAGYAPTFAPGTTSVADATRIQVAAGQEITADIQLTAARMLRVTGHVVTSAGKPVTGGFVRLVAKGEFSFGGMMGLGGPVREGGAFSINQVPPGGYILSVRTGDGPGMGPRRGDQQDDAEFAAMPITVAGEDLVNLRVVTGKGLTVSGVIVAEGATLPADQPVRVMIMPAEPEAMMMGFRPIEVQPDGRFQIEGVAGEGTFRVMNLPRGWMLKSVSYKGADVTDRPVEFASDGGPVRAVLTNRITVVTGTVVGTSGVPLTDYELLVFTEDTSRWSSPGRSVRVLRPDQQGVFKAESLPPGAYYIAAFEALDEENRTSPEFLEKVRSVAQQVTVAEGQNRTLTLRLSPLPQ